IYAKLGVHSRVEAARAAAERGLLDPPSGERAPTQSPASNTQLSRWGGIERPPSVASPIPRSRHRGRRRRRRVEMTTAERRADLLSEDMLARFDARAPIYDRENRFFDEDWDELREGGC